MAGLIALALAALARPGYAEPRLQERHGTSQRMDTAPVSRLIVKYRDDALAHIERRTSPTGRERAEGLTARHLHTKGSRKTLRLAFLKSLSAQVHVMRSETDLSRSDMLELARTIASDPQVEYAEIDERVYPLNVYTPNDPDYTGKQWNLQSPDAPDLQIGGANLPGAWGLAVGGHALNGAGVTVAVLDTGYRLHAELVGNLVPGYDFVSADSSGNFATANDGDGRDADAQDPGDWNSTASTSCNDADSTWHGTRVAGIIGAAANNVGTIGAAYGATILPVRVLGVCGGYVSDIAAGIQWAAGLGVPGVPNNTAHIAKVINLSIGANSSCSATFQDAITAARNAGSVIVVATGNDGATTISSPANCNGVIAVTAHDSFGDTSDYANVGAGTSISAPGGSASNGIYSTSNTGTNHPNPSPSGDAYVSGYGTSFAAPHVSAVAALLFQIRPTISPDAVLHYLTASARAYPSGPPASFCYGRTDCGAGLLDAYGAANALLMAQGSSNHAPVLAPIAPQTVAAGAALQFTVSATDADGDRISFTATSLPSGASFDGNAGTFVWGYALPGNYSVTIKPYDGLTNGDAQTVQIRVVGALGAGSGGGGGGALDATDLAAAALLLLVGWRLRRRHAFLSPAR